MSSYPPRPTTVGAAGLAAALALLTTGCSQVPDTSERSITVWSQEVQSERIAATQEIIDRFTAETGIEVRLVAVEEQQTPALIQSAVLSDSLPDVIGALPLAQVRQLDSLGLVDTDATGDVVEALDPATFADAALALTSDGDRRRAVPSDAWTQLLAYRTDLFEAAGLPAPTSYADIREAAETLHGDGTFGITLATDPTDPFTSQTFEALALGNGCELVDEAGTVQLDSARCAQTWDLTSDLADLSPRGTQTVDSTRATYFSGDAAMVVWSSFLLDELAGLRNDAMPACDQCQDDPGWLAENTGVVTAISGEPGTDPATYGEITSWTMLEGGQADMASTFVEYMMSEGYVDWLAMAPEGKVPMRPGDLSDPRRFADAWRQLPAGVDARVPLAEVYSSEVVDSLLGVGDDLRRWAIPQGQGTVLGPVISQLVIPKAVAELASGSTDARGAMEAATSATETIVEGLEP